MLLEYFIKSLQQPKSPEENQKRYIVTRSGERIEIAEDEYPALICTPEADATSEHEENP